MKNKNKILYSLILLTVIIFITTIFISKEAKIHTVKPHVSGAKKALEFWTQSRAYPNQDIPKDKFYKAYTLEKAKKKNEFKNNSTWEAIGPLNIAGRMLCVAPHPTNPDVLFAGSASGGLWRGVKGNFDYQWQIVETEFPVLGVSSIAIDATNPDNMYIGTGEVYGYKKSNGGLVNRTTRGSYGLGILKTTDGGLTWQKSLDWTVEQQRGVQCIRINPLNPKSIYAATTEGIYKTTNAGLNWQCILPIVMGQDIIIYPIDTTQVVVSCGNLGSDSSGVYYSTDAGKNWTKSTGLPEYSGKTLLDIFQTTPKYLFASVADSFAGLGLYRSANIGKTWYQAHAADVPLYQGWFSHFTAVHPTNINKVVHGGVRIYYSVSGGPNLNLQQNEPHVDHHNFARDPFNADRLYIACDGGIYVTEDFGQSFDYISYGLQTAQFYNGTSSSVLDSNLAMGGLQDNGVVVYEGSKSWRSTLGGDGCWTAINSADQNILYAETQYNMISKSTMRGFGFAPVLEGIYDDSAAFVAPFVLSPSNPAILYSGRTKIYKTTNAAIDWIATNDNQSLDGNYALSMAVSANNPNFVFVGTAPGITRSHIFKSTNGGVDWADITGILPDRYPMDIAIDPQNDKNIYVVFGGFGSGHVFKSSDMGNSWIDITGALPNVPTLAIIVDPLNSDHIYVGNDLGVYASTDGGQSWNSYNLGLPEAVIAMDLNISPTNRKLRLATHGNGAYQIPLLYTFDAAFVKINSILHSSTAMIGTALRFEVNAKNWGNRAQSDPFYVKMRVVNESDTEVFSYTDSVQILNIFEQKTMQFDQVFVPQDSGLFNLELITLGSSQIPLNDTLNYNITVLPTTSISTAKVTQKYSPYIEIKSIRKVREAQPTKIELPFKFVYDGFEYDQILVSDNGWVEFGTGDDGTERGVSSGQQLNPDFGGSERGKITNVLRPSKVLAPWWADLSRRLDQQRIFFGDVSYITEGIRPSRVFVIQWKDMFASRFSTTTLNFQVRLYELSGLIEFHYGDMLTGTYSGREAMIGLEDHIGGDYHFFDIKGGGTGLVNDARTDLDPLEDWPGPDSIYVIRTQSFSDITWQNVEGFALRQNYPNPFNEETTIEYKIPQRTKVQLKIFNILGQEVKTFVNRIQEEGNYTYTWKGINNFGNSVASGMYIVKLRTPNKSLLRKIILLK